LTVRVDYNVSANKIVRSIRKNGSLWSFKLLSRDDKELLSDTQSRLVQAYCQRNQEAPLLLANPRLDHDDEGDDNAAEVAAAAANKVILPVFPPLFAAALPAEHASCGTLLTGLLATSESCGGPLQDAE
jgi:hypothetical protein